MKRKLDDAAIMRAGDLREAGLSLKSIAVELGVSCGAIDWHMTKLAIDPPKTTYSTWDGIRGPAVTMRRSSSIAQAHVIRRYTPEEDAEILRLQAAGYSYCEIGRRLGRRHHSIIGRCNTLARREARQEAMTA